MSAAIGRGSRPPVRGGRRSWCLLWIVPAALGCKADPAARPDPGPAPASTPASTPAAPAGTPTAGATPAGTPGGLRGKVEGAIERVFSTGTAQFGAKYQRFHIALVDRSTSPPIVISFGRGGTTAPEPGTYQLGRSGGDFHGSLETHGSPMQEFDITGGTITLTTASATELAGSFTFQATGSNDTTGEVSSSGQFSAQPLK